MAPAMAFALATTSSSAAAEAARFPARAVVPTLRAQTTWLTHRSRSAAPVAAAFPPAGSTAACAGCCASAGAAGASNTASAATANRDRGLAFMGLSFSVGAGMATEACHPFKSFVKYFMFKVSNMKESEYTLITTDELLDA